ncbi:MAG: sulfate adenylyltransferase subunit CysN [Spirochaetes bacterium]|nr:sulfate adenylyltransferase subunit CysN [Spirochaetota bacterium]
MTAPERDLIRDDIESYLALHESKELLRFITCGSVDDGKSTLIGRLLHDSRLIYEDHLAAVRSDSRKYGTTGDDMDLALLVDGLQAEREQGITIDVAYRYFSTAKRKFIIADTPGHEQYTRNMATGASTASLAVILVDARNGIQRQTRRHSFIVSLLGIRRIVIAVNKMDLVNYDREIFNRIVADYRAFLGNLPSCEAWFIPLSALRGDNVVKVSEAMPWYGGPAFMELLETVPIDGGRDDRGLRFPVQYVNRPGPDFRGYCGSVASGSLRRGDEITALPSMLRSRVKSIVTSEGELDEAFPPLSVTVTLEDEIDVSRGDMLARDDDLPMVGSAFDATLIWMAEASLEPGRLYEMKFAHSLAQGSIEEIHHQVDVNTMAHIRVEHLSLNEIGYCRVRLSRPVVFDSYERSRSTGGFIVIDRVTHGTVAAGLIATSTEAPENRRSENVVWQKQALSRDLRAHLKRQKPCILWFTGLSGSGKSTVADALEQQLFGMGHHTYLLDGDNIRHGLNRDLGFGEADRAENIRRIGEVCRLFVDSGIIVLTAFISPYRNDRNIVRGAVEKSEFIEIYVATPIEICEARDVKGLYSRARRGEIRNFTGIDAPYEAPEYPEITIDTAVDTIDACVDRILGYLKKKQIIY